MERSEAWEIVREAAESDAECGEKLGGPACKKIAGAIREALAVLDAPDPRDALLKEAREVVDMLLRTGHNGEIADAVAREFLKKLDGDSDGPR